MDTCLCLQRAIESLRGIRGIRCSYDLHSIHRCNARGHSHRSGNHTHPKGRFVASTFVLLLSFGVYGILMSEETLMTLKSKITETVKAVTNTNNSTLTRDQ